MTKSDTVIQAIRAKEPVSLDDIQKYFGQRPPISPEFMLGDWRGTPVFTGNELVKQMVAHNWAGKTFHSVDQVDPMVCYNDKGEREVNETWGAARIREIKWKGVVSAAMVYNRLAVIDHFRHVDEKTVIGVMESIDHPCVGEDRLYFILERI